MFRRCYDFSERNSLTEVDVVVDAVVVDAVVVDAVVVDAVVDVMMLLL